MRNLKFKILLVALCLTGVSHCAFATNNYAATYENQRGSVLKLQWHRDKRNTGTLSGTFKTAVGNCPKDIGVPVPIMGFYNGNALSISINFPDCKQVVAMTGNIDRRKNKINTIWLDVRIAKYPLHKDWNTHLIGTDYFSKVS